MEGAHSISKKNFSQSGNIPGRTPMKQMFYSGLGENALVPKIILERVDAAKYLGSLSKKVKLEEKDENYFAGRIKEEFVAEEHFVDETSHAGNIYAPGDKMVSVPQISEHRISSFAEKFNNVIPSSVIDPQSGNSKTLESEGLGNNSMKNLNNDSEEFLKCLNAMKTEVDDYENHFVFLSDGELVSLKTEELIFDDSSTTETELCANDATLARCLAESNRRSGLRNLQKKSYRNQYACDECPLKFRFLKDLNRHSKEHVSDSFSVHSSKLRSGPKLARVQIDRKKLHHCHECSLSFSFLKDLKQHQKEHGVNVPYSRISAESYQNLDSSMNIYSSKSGLKDNLDASFENQIGPDVKPYCCAEFLPEFGTFENFNQVSMERTDTVSTTIFPAEPRSEEDLETHIEGQDENISVQKMCCSKTCQSKKNLPLSSFQTDLVSEQDSGAQIDLNNDSEENLTQRGIRQCSIARKDTTQDIRAFVQKPHHSKLSNRNFPAESVPDKNPPAQTDVKHGSEEKLYCCTVCSLKFLSLRGLKIHSATHKNKRKVDSCSRRKTRVSKKSLWYNDEHPFFCAHCPFKTNKKQMIRKHLKKHFDRTVYSCNVCSREFRELWSYRRHASVHSDKRPFSCPLCPAKQKASSSHRAHMRKHALNKIGEKRFSNELNIINNNQHVLKDPLKVLKAPTRNRHRGVDEKPFACERCPSRFTQNADLARHIRNVHVNKKFYPCNLCDRVYRLEETLKRHLAVHADKNRFACELCPAKFSEKRILRPHILLHFNGTVFMCANCFKRFKQKSRLKIHLKRGLCNSVTEKRFMCTQCSAHFTTKSSFKQHLFRQHMCERDLACPHCPKKLKGKRALKIHLLMHAAQTLTDGESGSHVMDLALDVPETVSNLETLSSIEKGFERGSVVESVSSTPHFVEMESNVPKSSTLDEFGGVTSVVNENGQAIRAATDSTETVHCGPEKSRDGIGSKHCLMQSEPHIVETLSEIKTACEEWIILEYTNESISVDIEG